MAGPDNRKHTRVPLAAKVQIKTEGLEKFIEKFSGNISRGGIFIKTPSPLPMGKEIVLTVVVPGGTQLIEAKGKVNWVRTKPDPDTGEPAGMGIEFDELGDGSKDVLEQIVLAGEARTGAAAAKPGAKPPAKAPAPASSEPKGPSLDTGGFDSILGEIEDSLGDETNPGDVPDAPSHKAAPTKPPAETPAPPAPKRESGGLDALMGDIESELEEKPIAGSATPGAGTATRGAGPQARAPDPPPAPAAPAASAAAQASSSAFTPNVGAAPSSGIVLGIDLGTTYSCAAYMKDGAAVVVPTDSGYRTLPSVVTITTEEQIVGRAAYDRIATHPKNTVYGSKRLLGRKFISRAVQDARKYFDYEIVGDENGNAAVRIDGEIYPLVMVTARILEEIRNWSRVHFQAEVDQALICVPAYYNDNQRAAVIEAGRLAGLTVKRIVNEPVAAALAYGFDKALQQRLLVYDLGGGTFDVSVMELTGNVFDVIAAGGDPYLGGVDFDNRIVDFLAAEFQKSSGVDITQDKVAILRLRAAAESAKRDLSEKSEVRIQLPYLARSEGGVASLDMVMKRSDLDGIVKELVDRTLAICGEVLAAAGIKKDDVDAVLLVGGQTRMPMIQTALTAFFGKPPRKGVHPDEAVAMGAALLASSMERVDSVVLLDVVSMSIGIGMPGGTYRPVLMRNTKLPAAASTGVATTQDGQTSISVDVFQGDGDLSESDYLGTIELEGFPAAPAGHFVFEISFRMDAQGFLVVIATERSSGMSQQMVMRTRESPEALQAVVGP